MMLQNKEWQAHASMFIVGKPISQYVSYTLYAAKFCLFHKSISIEQHENTSAIHPAIMENTKWYLCVSYWIHCTLTANRHLYAAVKNGGTKGFKR